jgi:hypothetical protein
MNLNRGFLGETYSTEAFAALTADERMEKRRGAEIVSYDTDANGIQVATNWKNTAGDTWSEVITQISVPSEDGKETIVTEVGPAITRTDVVSGETTKISNGLYLKLGAAAVAAYLLFK